MIVPSTVPLSYAFNSKSLNQRVFHIKVSYVFSVVKKPCKIVGEPIHTVIWRYIKTYRADEVIAIESHIKFFSAVPGTQSKAWSHQ